MNKLTSITHACFEYITHACFESFRIFCFISAVNYFKVITIVRATDELGFKVCLFSFQYSNIKGSFDLRRHNSVLGIRQRIELKSLTYFLQYINNRKKAFTGRIKLPTANFRLNNRSNQIFLLGKVSSSSKSFFHNTSLKRNSLPLSMRDTSVSLQVFKSRLKSFLLSESNAIPVQLANTWRDFRFN